MFFLFFQVDDLLLMSASGGRHSTGVWTSMFLTLQKSQRCEAYLLILITFLTVPWPFSMFRCFLNQSNYFSQTSTTLGSDDGGATSSRSSDRGSFTINSITRQHAPGASCRCQGTTMEGSQIRWTNIKLSPKQMSLKLCHIEMSKVIVHQIVSCFR